MVLKACPTARMDRLPLLQYRRLYNNNVRRHRSQQQTRSRLRTAATRVQRASCRVLCKPAECAEVQCTLTARSSRPSNSGAPLRVCRRVIATLGRRRKRYPSRSSFDYGAKMTAPRAFISFEMEDKWARDFLV